MYNTPSEREEVLREKSYYTNWEKEAAAGDQAEKWCYNCAREGHLGDVSSHMDFRLSGPDDCRTAP